MNSILYKSRWTNETNKKWYERYERHRRYRRYQKYRGDKYPDRREFGMITESGQSQRDNPKWKKDLSLVFEEIEVTEFADCKRWTLDIKKSKYKMNKHYEKILIAIAY